MRERTLPVHPATPMTRNEREAMRIFNKERIRKRLQPMCYGLYKVAALIGRQEILARMKSGEIREDTSRRKNRKRPKWCNKTTWESWMNFRRKRCASTTLKQYIEWKNGGPDPRKHMAPHKSTTLQRSPQEIVAAILDKASRK